MPARAPSPSRRDFVKFQTYNTAIRRLQRILVRWKQYGKKAILDRMKSNWDLSVNASDSRLRTVEADYASRRRVERGLNLVVDILAASLKGARFTAWKSWQSNWQDAARSQRNDTQRADLLAQTSLSNMHDVIDTDRQANYHLRICAAADSLANGEIPNETEIQAAEMLLWTLRAARLHRLDMCVEALDLLGGAVEGVLKRSALHSFRQNCPRRKAKQKPKRRIFAAETRQLWILEEDKAPKAGSLLGRFLGW